MSFADESFGTDVLFSIGDTDKSTPSALSEIFEQLACGRRGEMDRSIIMYESFDGDIELFRLSRIGAVAGNRIRFPEISGIETGGVAFGKEQDVLASREICRSGLSSRLSPDASTILSESDSSVTPAVLAEFKSERCCPTYFPAIN